MGYKPGREDLNTLKVDTTTLVVDEANNRVGIGTASPTVQLHVESSTTLSPQLKLLNTNANNFPAILQFEKQSASQADDDYLGLTNYQGYDSAGNSTTFIQIAGQASDVTDGDEGAQWGISVLAAGTQRALLKVGGQDVANSTACEVAINEAGIDCNFRVESDGNANMLFVDGEENRVGIGTGEPVYNFDCRADGAGFAAMFFNDGDNVNRQGILIKCGTDNPSGVTNTYLVASDGDGGTVGSITDTSETFQLNDLCDVRLKKNIVDTNMKGLETLAALKVRDFQLKKSNTAKTGFIAQELETVYPAAVSKYDDDVMDPNGGPMMWGVSKEGLVPVLVKALQELSAKVEELEAKLNNG